MIIYCRTWGENCAFAVSGDITAASCCRESIYFSGIRFYCEMIIWLYHCAAKCAIIYIQTDKDDREGEHCAGLYISRIDRLRCGVRGS